MWTNLKASIHFIWKVMKRSLFEPLTFTWSSITSKIWWIFSMTRASGEVLIRIKNDGQARRWSFTESSIQKSKKHLHFFSVEIRHFGQFCRILRFKKKWKNESWGKLKWINLITCIPNYESKSALCYSKVQFFF